MVFSEAGAQLSPNVSAIIIGAIQVVGVQISVILVDRAGRKFLLIISAVFCFLGQATFSFYDYLKVEHEMDVSQYNWIPLLSFSIVITFANFGETLILTLISASKSIHFFLSRSHLVTISRIE